jgi:glycosyltransferase involved in cell wall biosynthesis
MRTLIIIPAYNEERRIGRTLKQTQKFSGDILVVDDGSMDNTTSVSEDYGVFVIRSEQNIGKGNALTLGFKWAIDNDYDAVITLDADGQHSPHHIPAFIDKLKEGYDIVIGNRLHNLSSMPKERIFSNHLVSFISSLLCSKLLRDAQTGYRAIKVDVLRNIPLIYSGFEQEIEFLMKSGRAGYKIGHIPIMTIYTGEEESKIKPMREIYRFTRMFLSEIFNS